MRLSTEDLIEALHKVKVEGSDIMGDGFVDATLSLAARRLGPINQIMDDKVAFTTMQADKKESYTFIQWKGSKVCMDFTCKCGNDEHLCDEYSAYYIHCAKCDTTYQLNPFIELVEIENIKPELIGGPSIKLVEDYEQDQEDEVNNVKQD